MRSTPEPRADRHLSIPLAPEQVRVQRIELAVPTRRSHVISIDVLDGVVLFHDELLSQCLGLE